MIGNHSIPKSWSITSLGNVCKLKNGFAFKSEKYISSGIPVIRISDIGDGKVDLSECVKVNTDDIYLDYRVFKGDILVAMSGATTGKFGIYNSDQVAFQNQRVGKFQVLEKKLLLNSFLLYLLYSLKRKILEDAYGGAQPNISSGKIEEMLIPLPPLAEQHRIVAKIEELFSELDKGVETLKSAQAQLQVYRQAVLKYAFEGKLTNPGLKDGELPEGWSLKRLENIGSVINGDRSSNYPSRAHYVDTGVPFLSAGNIENNKLVVSSLNYITRAKFKSLRSGKTEIGDILYCLRGSLGKSAIVEIPEAAIASSLCILRPLPGVSSNYVHYFLSSPLAQLEILKYDNGTAQPNLSSKSFEDFTIPICAYDEQVEIVEKIESRLSVCDKIEESIEQGLQQAEALRQSILKRAFEGKLVPQDPNDEPASVLLERIKAERNNASPVKKTKTKKTKV